MKKLQRDPFWNGTTIGCDAALVPWLHDHSSLTKRIQQRCDQFSVSPVRSGLARIAYDESALLSIAPQQLAYSREIFLYADGKPVVFAHSTCAIQHLRGVWAALAGLGNKSLGTMLFTHPLVERRPLHYKALRSHHSLYQSAMLERTKSPTLWARRSLFYLHGAPLLVTEVFLPEILLL
ncbi:MAG: chorismate--pyruvate lyase family protein [Gallionellaceae bacterium]|jgi:chorismate--pyruvate lyase